VISFFGQNAVKFAWKETQVTNEQFKLAADRKLRVSSSSSILKKYNKEKQ